MSLGGGGRIAVHEFEDFLIGSIQVELSDAVAAQFRDDLLDAGRHPQMRFRVLGAVLMTLP